MRCLWSIALLWRPDMNHPVAESWALRLLLSVLDEDDIASVDAMTRVITEFGERTKLRPRQRYER